MEYITQLAYFAEVYKFNLTIHNVFDHVCLKGNFKI